MTAFDKDLSARRASGRSNVARLLRTVAELWDQLAGDGLPRDLSTGGPPGQPGGAPAGGGPGPGRAASGDRATTRREAAGDRAASGDRATGKGDDDAGDGDHDPIDELVDALTDEANPRFDDFDELDDELDDEPDDERDWRRWYDSHRRHMGQVPVSVVSACLDDVREAGILHSVALLEIARKWGFDPRAD